MKLLNKDTKEYLKRLEISQGINLNEDFLVKLHHSHLKNIPYENFDIINKLSFNLDDKKLFF